MGLFTPLRQWLDRRRTPTVHEPGGLEVTPAAFRAARRMPQDHALCLEGHEGPSGWQFTLQERPQEPSALPEKSRRSKVQLPIVTSADVHAAASRLQVHHDGAWRLQARLTVQPRETPNPLSRAYDTDRRLCTGRRLVRRGQASQRSLAGRLLTHPGIQSVLVNEGMVSVERSPGTAWSSLDVHVHQTIRAWLMSGEPPDEDTPVRRPADAFHQSVWEVLVEQVLPGLHKDGGDLELLAIEDGVAQVRFIGACADCPASTLTLQHGVRRTLLAAFPGQILDVQAV